MDGKESAAAAVVRAGWARAKPPAPAGKAPPAPGAEEAAAALAAAQAAAEGARAGLHAADGPPPAPARGAEADAAALAARGELRAIVEAAPSGSTLRVTLLPELTSCVVLLAGVACPSMGRRAAADAGAEAAAPAPESWAREARHFAELRALNREVTLVPAGVSQHGQLVAGVRAPPPPAPPAAPAADGTAPAPAAPATPAEPTDLALALARAGLARVAEWSAAMLGAAAAARLREAERAARVARAGCWRDAAPPPAASAKPSDRFSGVVAEVASGDCLVVKDAASGAERRVCLASVRAPRGAARERAGEPWAAEAKEFLRARLIGKPVAVQMEYARKVPAPGAGPAAAAAAAGAPGRPVPAAADERTMHFATVTVEERGAAGEAPRVSNVAELLLVRGLTQVARHRGDEERAGNYEALAAAEEAGRRSKKGQWGARAPAPPRVNDVAAPGGGARARALLPHLQRAGALRGVVEHVAGGSRLRVHVPAQSATLAFSPAGVRAPARGGGAAGAPAEPLGAEALAFTRGLALQREVELEVETVDRAGTFLGRLRVLGGARPVDLGEALLRAGLGRLHAAFDPARAAGGAELAAAEAAARAARAGVWEHEAPEAAADAEEGEGAEGEGGGAAAAAPARAPGAARLVEELVVTDVVDAADFFVQLAPGGRAAWVAERLAALELDAGAPPATPLRAGDACLARFAADRCWYRARVEAVDKADPSAPRYDVYFVDFGNRERAATADVRPAPPDLAAVPPQAAPAALAGVRAPPLASERGADAAALLSELAGGGRRLAAVVEGREVAAPAAAPGKPRGWGAKPAAAAAAAAAPAAPARLRVVLLGAAGGGEGAPALGAPAPADASAYEGSVNVALVAAGLARVAEPRGGGGAGGGPLLEALRAAEAAARSGRVGMWEYGDPGSDEEEGEGAGPGAFPALGGAGGRRR